MQRGDHPTAVGAPFDPHQRVQRRVHLLADDVDGGAVGTGDRERGEAVDGIRRRRGVHRRHRAVVAGPEGPHHVGCLGAADLTDHDAVRSQTQGDPHEVAEVRPPHPSRPTRAGLQADDAPTGEAQLGDVLTAVARERAQVGRNGVYDVEVRNQADVVIAHFRGKSTRIKGHVLEGSSP